MPKPLENRSPVWITSSDVKCTTRSPSVWAGGTAARWMVSLPTCSSDSFDVTVGSATGGEAGVVIFALGHAAPPAAVVAALLAYRAIYFVLPLLLAGAMLLFATLGGAVGARLLARSRRPPV